jgi:CheY-like chemotaxis protein
MKVLVIDDDPNKMRQLTECIREFAADTQVLQARSYQSGLKAALFEGPDLVVLDMTMPTFDVGGKETGGRERRYAGLQILRQLKRKETAVATVVVTQFEQFGEGDDQITLAELRVRLAKEFPGSYLGTIYYQAGDSKWRDELRDTFGRVCSQ